MNRNIGLVTKQCLADGGDEHPDPGERGERGLLICVAVSADLDELDLPTQEGSQGDGDLLGLRRGEQAAAGGHPNRSQRGGHVSPSSSWS
ncbi:unannotated protein [freshwater metagenome]|uniref:Unannotated protein n=1 Tax=freshwater metagenome TaxID=449393 RepID=A0A6J7BST6_9ZZZZ